MKKLCLVLASLFTLMLVGCNGPIKDDTENTLQVVANIKLSLFDSADNAKQRFTKNDTITLQAKVTDENNALILNKAVSFSVSTGSLNPASTLTNSEGIATVYITNESLSLGAGIASATIGEVSAQTIDYEFLESDTSNILPNLTTVMTLNNDSVNQFKANQEVQMTSTLTDGNGQGISGKIIAFTADIGTLSIITALTNNQGVANVTLTGNDNIIGAGVLTSSYSLDENTNINSTLNYQILSAAAIIDSNIRLGYFDESNSFFEGKIELSITNKSISAGGT